MTAPISTKKALKWLKWFYAEDELEEEVEEDSDDDVGELEVDVAESSEEFVAKSRLKWLSKPKPPTRRYQRNVVTAKSSPTDYVQNAVTLKNYFDVLITDDIKRQICTHTNEEAERDIATWNSAHPNSPRQ
ncbi:hypothetical protein QE152_g23453 [Popillia japonica]|uniref:Uncharacterized protein n=1 Tax=Popillia japonica TaxID=7064 RepID=A0AAW1KHE5_POPJA